MFTHIARTMMVVFGLFLLILPGCSKSIQGSAGDKFSQRGLKSDGGRLSDGSRRPGDRPAGPGQQPGESGLQDDPLYSGSGEPLPSLSQFQRPGSEDLSKSSGEHRVGAEEIVSSPSSSRGGGRSLTAMDRGDRSQPAGLSDVFFGFNTAVISEEGRQVLLQNADWMKSNPAKRLVIEGHCDERGTLAYNLVLGENRAKAIQKFLVDQEIDGRRLNVVSYGKEHPFCQDADERCYQQNRRGHLVVKN
ncbi:MAG TPA: OmpA family protein [Nitrospiraceae bacterium]|nr:OmpA family protein [Nitrospiraceae bacterium]